MLSTNRIKTKKGQGLPLNVVILTILGIIVLVVIIALIYNYTAKFGKETRTATESKCPGSIKPIGECDEPIYGKFANVTAGYVCCKDENNNET